MREHHWMGCLAVFLLYVLAVLPPAETAGTYEEDFTTAQYCDTTYTTAWWDTCGGELKLYHMAPTLVGSYNTAGNAYKVAVSGNYAYVADRSGGLQVIRITDPSAPAYAGAGAADAYDVVVSGDYAYVADGGGFVVFDISDPTNPDTLGYWDTAPAYFRAVEVSGDYAYLASNSIGFVAVDISDPSNPAPGGGIGGNGSGIAISGDYAYVVLSGALHVADISDPANPTSVMTYPLTGTFGSAAVSGDNLYIATDDSVFLALYIGDPASPDSAGSCRLPDFGMDIAVSGDYAYVAGRGQGVFVMDISDPTNPRRARSYDTPAAARGVAHAGEHVYVADGASGLHVLDIADPVLPPELVGTRMASGPVRDIAISGDYGYLLDSYYDFRVIDISDPTFPTTVATCELPYYSEKLDISGDYAYVSAMDSGLYVVDISDPLNPVLAGHCGVPGEARGVTISGDCAYVGASLAGLQVVDISDPTNPAVVGGYNTSGLAFAVAIAGDYAYVADYNNGLTVTDISDPAIPTYVGGYSGYPLLATEVAVAGDYAYVADWNGYLRVIDISDPANPYLAGDCTVPSWVNDLAVCGDYAFVTSSRGVPTAGLQVIDISDPLNPAILDRYILSNANGIEVSGYYAYVTDGSSGHKVFRIFQHDLDTAKNEAGSLRMTPGGIIESVRLTTVQTDSIIWEISVQLIGGWQVVTPGTGWVDLPISGASLRWRSTHIYAGGSVNPTCSYLRIDYAQTPDPAGVEDPLPQWEFSMAPCSSNPGTGETAIHFTVAEPTVVRLTVHDVMGREVAVLADGHHRPGEYTEEWDGRSSEGEAVGPGIYFVRIHARGFTDSDKIVLLR